MDNNYLCFYRNTIKWFINLKLIPLKIDIHVHSTFSDSTATLDDIVKVAKEKGLDGVVITDHDTTVWAKEAISKKNGLIYGEEVTKIQNFIFPNHV